MQAHNAASQYEFRADPELPTPSDAISGQASLKNSSSFVMSSTSLLDNVAQGAGGAVFVTSQSGVYLFCNPNPADTGQSFESQHSDMTSSLMGIRDLQLES